jgi:hypothetical protein
MSERRVDLSDAIRHCKIASPWPERGSSLRLFREALLPCRFAQLESVADNRALAFSRRRISAVRFVPPISGSVFSGFVQLNRR